MARSGPPVTTATRDRRMPIGPGRIAAGGRFRSDRYTQVRVRPGADHGHDAGLEFRTDGDRAGGDLVDGDLDDFMRAIRMSGGDDFDAGR